MEEMHGDGENETENGVTVLDPRAGAIDVILPQLPIDYNELYEKLVQLGAQKEVKMRNRKLMYQLAFQ